MASIRLFGRGRTQAAPGGSPVSAAQIAQVLEQVATASLSATWRCRHTAGTSIGEGAVDFGARRSRATVIRGRYAFEYVRSGSTVYRTVARVEEQGANGEAAAASSRPAAVTAQVEQEEQEEQERDGSDLEPGEEDLDRERELFEPEGGGEGEAEDSDGGEHAESEDVEEPGESGGSDLEAEADADDSEDDADDPGDDAEDADGDDSDDDGNGGVKGGRDDLRWQTFSEHDPCGMHAYAEPAVLAAAVRAAGTVQARDAQQFDGMTLAAYSVTLKPKPGDPDKALARLARQLRDHGATVLVVTAFVDESDSGEIDPSDQADHGDADGSDGASGGAGPRIVRVRVHLPFWTPADDPTCDHTVSVDLFEFGEPVRIETPDAGSATRRTSRSCADFSLF